MSEPKQPIIFQSKEVQEAVVSLVTGKKPIGWSRKSRSPYFSMFYGLQMQVSVDEQLKSGKDIFYPEEQFCKGAGSVSLQTLYARINQSIRFLCERLDKEGLYTKWYSEVQISKRKGVRLSLHPHLGEIKPTFSVARAHMPTWKREFEEWLDSGDVEPFVREHLSLLKEEMEVFRAEINEMESVIGSVTSGTIKVVKVSR